MHVEQLALNKDRVCVKLCSDKKRKLTLSDLISVDLISSALSLVRQCCVPCTWIVHHEAFKYAMAMTNSSGTQFR